jgi:EAL domain-containing protein (putative c-di-GMP-specific phosphodiesterase class I)
MKINAISRWLYLTLLKQLNRELRIVFQPIYDLISENIAGFEALARGPAGPYSSPECLFRFAGKRNMLDEVEMCCFKLAVEKAVRLPGKVFFNFTPGTLIKYHREIIQHLQGMYDRAGIELIECAVTEKNYVELAKTIEELHAYGVKVSLDDVGKGDRDLSVLCDLEADFMKIDRRFIQNLARTQNKRKSCYKLVLQTLLELSRLKGMKVIAEGIETKIHFTTVEAAGISLAQGFYFSRPMPAPYWRKNIKSTKSVCLPFKQRKEMLINWQ